MGEDGSWDKGSVSERKKLLQYWSLQTESLIGVRIIIDS